jgi:hypothetical protein
VKQGRRNVPAAVQVRFEQQVALQGDPARETLSQMDYRSSDGRGVKTGASRKRASAYLSGRA